MAGPKGEPLAQDCKVCGRPGDKKYSRHYISKREGMHIRYYSVCAECKLEEWRKKDEQAGL